MDAYGARLKYKYVLLDLDGTLTDPGEGIRSGAQYALKRFGIEERCTEALNRFIGPPLTDSFNEYYGICGGDAEAAVAAFREYYSVTGLYQNVPYPGVEGFLEKLKALGASIVLSTSKPAEFALKILKRFGLYGYFDYFAGATFDGERVKKGDVVRYAIGLAGIADVKNAVMIGDRKHDVLGAAQNGMDSIGVLYGYGSKSELETAGATYIAAGFNDILKILTGSEN